jgi:hypothetical protein
MAYVTHSYVNENGDFDTWDEYVPDDDPNAGQTVYEQNPDVGGNVPFTTVELADGSVIYKDPSAGKYYDAKGTPVDATGTTLPGSDPSSTKFTPPSGLLDKIKGAVKDNPYAIALGTAAAIKALKGGNDINQAGWQGTIPLDRQMVRSQVQYDDTNRRPGEGGRQYFTDPNYVPTADIATARKASDLEASGIAAGYKPSVQQAPKFDETHPAMAMPWAKRAATTTPAAPSAGPASGVASLVQAPSAQDVINGKTGGFAAGGQAQPRYLQGATDGMADKIPSSIDGKQKAALSHGEFVIPADVVSHLGNGNSDAGAQKLYQMMAKVRQARTGNSEQGKRIDPNKFMPGGPVHEVKMAEGGVVSHFVEGGPATTTAMSTLGTTGSQNLSNWAGPYVSDYLSKGAAVANTPYQAYKGKLTAGPSELEQQEFSGLSSLAQTGYDPTKFTGGTFDANAASAYMNPYLSAALNPQLEELRRQGQITNLGNQAQATKQGAFGSSGSVLMQTEGQRNVLDKMQKALGEGYNTAYDKAQSAYASDAQRALDAQKQEEQSRQYSSDFGLKSLDKLGAAGATQRNIEQAGLTADQAQFAEQRDYPAKMVQYQKDLLQGLPVTTTQTTPNQTDISSIANSIAGLQALYASLSNLGQGSPTTTPTTTTPTK